MTRTLLVKHAFGSDPAAITKSYFCYHHTYHVVDRLVLSLPYVFSDLETHVICSTTQQTQVPALYGI